MEIYSFYASVVGRMHMVFFLLPTQPDYDLEVFKKTNKNKNSALILKPCRTMSREKVLSSVNNSSSFYALHLVKHIPSIWLFWRMMTLKFLTKKGWGIGSPYLISLAMKRFVVKPLFRSQTWFPQSTKTDFYLNVCWGKKSVFIAVTSGKNISV